MVVPADRTRLSSSGWATLNLAKEFCLSRFALYMPIAVSFQLPAMNWTLCSADLCGGVTKVQFGTSEPTDGGGPESYP